MKKIILILILSNVLFAGVEQYYKSMTVDQKMIDNVERFKHLENKKNSFDIERYKSLKERDIVKEIEDIDTKLIKSIEMYSGNDFITKDEYKTLSTNVLKARKLIKKYEYSEYILFLTSESVPNSTYMNVLHSVGILQENGVRIKTKQYLIGIPDDFEAYMIDKKEYMNNLTEKERGYILKNFTIKLDPRKFEEFNIKKVPAIVHAICKGKNPVKENCEYKYLIHGDTSLSNFFDKISETESKYKKYHEFLIGNKIIYDQKEEIK